MSRYRRSRVEGGTFFFTVAVANRRSDLLTEHIAILRNAYGKVQKANPFKTLAICVLPDHLHAVWQLPEGDGDFSSRWSHIKAGFSRSLPAQRRSTSKVAKREKGIWQRRFWERQIRDDRDLQKHVDYTHFNPAKHGLVRHVRDWPYSSFHRYVRKGTLPPDWGGDATVVVNVGEPW